jgi:glycosyltransferase involved in cell wall biosynthesis
VAEQRYVVLHTRVVAGAGGGPDKTILNSPRFLRGTPYDLVCAYFRHPDDPGFARLQERARHWQAELVGVDDRGPFDFKLLRRCRELCERYRPAVWHAHDYKSNLLGLLLARRFPDMHLVTTVHGWVHHTWRTRLYYAIDRFCLRRYEHVICVSEDLHADCLAAGVRAERCTHIPNAIDTEEFRRTTPVAAAKAALGAPAAGLLVGAVGRLSAEKGFDLLIRAVHRLLQEGLDLHLWIAGEGDQEEPLRRLVGELGLADRVRLLGFCAKPLDLYQALDVFALSSLREGLPNVLLEAMAVELPVLATRIAGIPTLIRHEDDGLLIEPGSVDELAAGLRRLGGDPGLRSRLGRAARAKIVAQYSFTRRMERVRAVYDKVLGLPPVPGDGGATEAPGPVGPGLA